MSTPTEVLAAPSHPTERPADRFMRGLLRVPAGEPRVSSVGAHRALRISLVISGIRCLATYLVIPILVPVLGFAGIFAAPVGIALSLIAMASGIAGVRRFWLSNHRAKWVYTWFMAFVFVILTIFLVTDIIRLVG